MKKNIFTIIVFMQMTLVANKAFALYAHVNGAVFACPDSELFYTYDDDYGCGNITFTLTNGKIYNEITSQWVTVWSFTHEESSQYGLNSDHQFRVKWDNKPIPTMAKIKVTVCDCNFPICSSGEKVVTIGPSPNTQYISGSNNILSCINQNQKYTVQNTSVDGWRVMNWQFSSNIKQYGNGLNPIYVEAQNSTSQGNATLSATLNFVVSGKTCGSQNISKQIWLGIPELKSKTLDGQTYSGYASICPGNHWVGVEWNGLVTSTNWVVTPGILYSAGTNQLDFTFPTNGFSGISITVNAGNQCGNSSNSSFYLTKKTYGCGSFFAIVYPNPSADEMTVSLASEESYQVIDSSKVIDEMSLVDENKTNFGIWYPKSKSITIDIVKIPSGMYFLHIVSGNDKIIKTIFIK